MQWVTHGLQLTRYVTFGKFMAFRMFIHDTDEDAKKAAELEDQDFYGIGSRS